MIGSVLLCVLICIIYAFWKWKVHFRGENKLPPLYPGVLPIVGHLHILVGDGLSLWRTVKSVSAEAIKQGGVICMLLGPELYYFITDPEDALTAANACLPKHFTYNYVKPWLGEGLITASGEKWIHHRKLLTPAFGLPVIYGFLDVFNKQARSFVKILKQEVGKPFDHTFHLRNIALETFCLTAFGISGFEDEDFFKKYMHATEEIIHIVTSRFQNFWFQNDFIFKVCGLKRKQDKFVKIVNEMSDKVIQKKRAVRNKNHDEISGNRYKPFLDLLLELSDGNALTDKESREEVDTAILAGFDTTSSLLTYIMILLGTHPNVQEKIYKEINEVFESDRDVEKGDLQKLVYIEAVIKESLRIFTVAPVTIRSVDNDVKLKNYTMRAGSQCMILLFGVNRDPVWGKDANLFRPERWLDPEMPPNPTAFAGFSLGRRSCIGKAYAMITMKTTLVHLLRHYKIEADDSNLKLRFDFVLKPVSGHEITIQERLKTN